jgi:L-arabinonolactonase
MELEGAVPDGSCVDADGYLWSATWWNGIQGSRVRRIDPATGKVVFEVHTPDGTSRVSCCCFGGPNLDILFITTAGEGSDATKEPHAGGLYAIKLEGVKGKLEHRFQI